MEDVYKAASADRDIEEDSDSVEEEQPESTCGEAVPISEMVRQHVTSFPMDASMQRFT